MTTRRKEKWILVGLDWTAAAVVFFLFYLLRFKTGLIDNPVPLFLKDVPVPLMVVSLTWVLFFWFMGLYNLQGPISRFDEVASVAKAVTIGSLILFVATVQLPAGLSPQRLILLSYWAGMTVGVTGMRLAFRTVQRRRFMAGKGYLPTLVVGWNDRARDIATRLEKFPALGYRVVGFVSTRSGDVGSKFGGTEVLGHTSDLPRLIETKDVKEIILALSTNDHQRMLEVINYVNGESVGIKIIPDLYDIISGQARTNQIYGFPLVDILPELMPAWEASAKRLIDIAVSLVVLTLFIPLALIVSAAVKLDSKGKVIYRQERVGRDGKIFHIFKFRSMTATAEDGTGPVWATEDDPRITRVGRVLRSLYLDEVPQLLNVLLGDMSLVGPRPERPYFVEQLKKELPLYSRRLRIRPGITGWAQVKHKYDASFEDVKRKLRYDLFYIENMSLRMDFKILFSTLRVMATLRGR